MFVGRQQELAQLNGIYESNEFEFVVISGRRHIGKTALISEFVKDKRAVLFSAKELTDKYNLKAFEDALITYYADMKIQLPDWNSGFECICERAGEDRLVVVFENYTDACLTNKDLSGMLAETILKGLCGSKVMLILSGNHMAALDREILSEKSVLFPHLTAHLYLSGLPFEDARLLMDRYSLDEQRKLYNCIGGTPLYLSLIDHSLTASENISRLFFDRCGFLYNDIGMLLQKELIGPVVYNSLLRAIAYGKTKAREILEETGEESGKAHKYLNVLLSMGILCRDIPEGADPNTSRKGTWRFTDNAHRFWYRYVLDNQERIDKGCGSSLLTHIEDWSLHK